MTDVHVNACLNKLHINDIFVEQYLYYRSNPSNQGYTQSHTIHSHYCTLHTFQCISPNSLGQNIHEGKLYQEKIIITFINQNNMYYLLVNFSMWVLDSIFNIHFLMHMFWKLCWRTCLHTCFTLILLITGSTSS